MQRKGVWEKLNHALRGRVRSKLGKSTQPSALAKLAVGIAADNQSVKTAEKREPVRYAASPT
ncbi:transposase [Calothrix sp. NIES-4101]|nr:transposase [Calothrix sp. NIES-4101]